MKAGIFIRKCTLQKIFKEVDYPVPLKKFMKGKKMKRKKAKEQNINDSHEEGESCVAKKERKGNVHRNKSEEHSMQQFRKYREALQKISEVRGKRKNMRKELVDSLEPKNKRLRN